MLEFLKKNPISPICINNNKALLEKNTKYFNEGIETIKNEENSNDKIEKIRNIIQKDWQTCCINKQNTNECKKLNEMFKTLGKKQNEKYELETGKRNRKTNKR